MGPSSFGAIDETRSHNHVCAMRGEAVFKDHVNNPDMRSLQSQSVVAVRECGKVDDIINPCEEVCT